MADRDKKLSAVLEFKDGFSAVVKKAGDGVRKVGSEAGRAASGVRGLGSAFASAGINVDAFNSKVKKVGSSLASSAFNKTKSALKGLAVGAVATGSAMAVMGFKAASSIEQYKNTLDTVLKDPKKASATLEWANKFADETPFQNKEVMDATVKLHAYKLDPQVFLKTIGDTAATMGKSLDQAVEAFADASVGELERLKEFGIKKNDVIDFGEKIGLKDFVDSKGTITDANKFMLSLSKLMEDRHKDGMEKQSKTVAGLWSTILGKSQSALAKFVGMNRDGSSRAGSAFELFKSKLETVVNKFNEMEADGTLERWSKKIDEEIVPRVSQAFDNVNGWVKSSIEWFGTLKKEDLVAWGEGIKTTFSAIATVAEGLASTVKFLTENLWILKYGAAAFVGAKAGGAVGSVIPGAGTAVGALTGAVIGMTGVAIGDGASNLGEKLDSENENGWNKDGWMDEPLIERWKKQRKNSSDKKLNVEPKTEKKAFEKSFLSERVEKIKTEKEELGNYSTVEKNNTITNNREVNEKEFNNNSTVEKNNTITNNREVNEKEFNNNSTVEKNNFKEKVVEKLKSVNINITGPISINNGMDMDTFANRLVTAITTQC